MADDGQTFRTLTHRSDMTGADRTWAARYNVGDVLQYTTGSKAEGIERGSFATVRSVDARTNTLTVELEDGSSVTYDPRRLRGVNVFRETEREFATGDRIQFTAPNKDLGVANRDLGTVVGLEDGKMTVRLDGKADRTHHIRSRGVPPVRPRLRRHLAQLAGPYRRPRPRQHRHRFLAQSHQ